MVKVGIISFAHMHAYEYAQSLMTLDHCELVAVYDEDTNRGQDAAKQYTCSYFNDLTAFLEQDMDCVIITSENSKHKEHVLACAQAKKDILCEKPIATNVEDAQAMIDACEKEAVKLQIAYPVRFCDAIKEGKKLVESGKLGEIQFIKTNNRGRNPGGWFVDKALSGGGAVLDHTVHMVDVVRWYTGAEIVEVSAQIGNFYDDIKIDDAGILDFKFNNGMLMTHDCSWSKNKKYPTWGDVTIEIIGSQASVQIDAFKDHFIAYRDDTCVQEIFSGNDMNLELIEDFIANVADNKTPTITGYDGLKTMEAALVSYQSAEENRTIRIGD